MTTTRRLFFALLTAVGFILMEAISGVQAPAPDFTQGAEAAVVIPTWADVAADFPRCEQERGGLPLSTQVWPSAFVVADADTGEVTKVSVDAAWKRITDDNPANDVWTLGACPR